MFSGRPGNEINWWPLYIGLTARLLPASERGLLQDTKLHVLNEAGLEHLLLKLADPEAKKLLMYLRREAYFPFKRARGQAVDVPTSRGKERR